MNCYSTVQCKQNKTAWLVPPSSSVSSEGPTAAGWLFALVAETGLMLRSSCTAFRYLGA